MKKKSLTQSARSTSSESPRCGLCGSTSKPLTRMPCCGHWICDDEEDYVLFSFARNSCHRNHDRYTLCSHHFHEGHRGRWQDCTKCGNDFDTEMYVYYGTNEYNFEKLENSPSFKPTHCAECGRVIHLGTDGYTIHPNGKYACWKCANNEMRRILASERIGRAKARRTKQR